MNCFEYGGTAFDRLDHAICAAVGDFLWAGGQNSRSYVAGLDPADATRELLANWLPIEIGRGRYMEPLSVTLTYDEALPLVTDVIREAKINSLSGDVDEP